MKIFWLMVAGAGGTLARYGISVFISHWALRSTGQALTSTPFPLATLVVNVLGSFLLAVLVTLALKGWVSPDLRLILGTGFLGAFTTFSTFELEAAGLLESRLWPAATCYIAGNLLLGFMAILLGRALALRVLSLAT